MWQSRLESHFFAFPECVSSASSPSGSQSGGITDNNLDFYTGIIIYVTFSDIVFLTFGVILHKWRIEKMPNSLQLQEKNNSMILTMECFFVYLFFEKTFDFSVVFS